MQIEFNAIGVISSPFIEKFSTPRQGSLAPDSTAEIKLNNSVPAGSLEGLREFSHIWIIFHFHLNTHKKVKGKVYPPRLNGLSIGWAATRSPHRPNNIGMTLAKLEEISHHRILVSGIDLIHGTPIIDIKPYIASSDRPNQFYEGWTSELALNKLSLVWSQEAQDRIVQFSISQKLMNTVEQSLTLDPRPIPRKEGAFAAKFSNWDFIFSISKNEITINEILELQS